MCGKRMQKERKLLIRELTWTVLCLGAAMLTVWFLFYVNIQSLLKKYVMRNTEQVSSQILTELERSFLQTEEFSFALTQSEVVKDFFLEEAFCAFVARAGELEDFLSRHFEGCIFMDNVILYNEAGTFYRLSGSLDNTAVRRLIQVIDVNGLERHVQIRLEDTNYIGCITMIQDNNQKLGTAVMLTRESDILGLFEQLSGNERMKIALAAGGQVLLTNYKEYQELSVLTIRERTNYAVYKKIGFTPFELLVCYEESNHAVQFFFMAAMVLLAVLLLALLEVFLHFWRKKFFAPIQSVITEVESFEGGKGEQLPLTGMEHFDGLVQGINEMVERIEQKEKEVYEATYSLQESELKKQRALIVSLKKQISAHFTVNVLSIIKALSSSGENEKAGLLCDGLSFLLRYANAGDTMISGMEEFFVLEKYAEIMEIRYPGRFTVEIDMVDELEKIEIPRMLLQPILENSIVHGIVGREMPEAGHVHVYSELTKEAVLFIISDNGCGMSSAQLMDIRNEIEMVDEDNVEVEGLSHVALVNIQRRIRSYFGEAYGICVEAEQKNGTRVTVKLPIKHRFV